MWHFSTNVNYYHLTFNIWIHNYQIHSPRANFLLVGLSTVFFNMNYETKYICTVTLELSGADVKEKHLVLY